MEMRSLGRSDLRVSVVGLGCNNFGRIDFGASRKVVDRALDLGITLLDTADVYGERGGSETQLGEILGPRRKDIVLATKFGMPMDDAGEKKGASHRYIMEAVEASLKRLKTGWIDLYQLHQPDPATPLEETLGTLNELVQAGKVRAIGCSNLSAAQIAEAADIARAKQWPAFVSAQDEYSVLARGIERELIPELEREHMGLLPYFPLASGMLTGKYKRNEQAPAGSRMALIQRHADRFLSEENWNKVEKLEAFCAARGHTMLELAFSWLASRPWVASVIAGATRPEQIEQNVQAVNWKLTPEDITEIDRITAPE
jgi:aryl-alcohol dehydrogenase-like predicted oxidoreductase